MLQDYRMPILGGSKRGAPAIAEFFAPIVALKGVEVTIGKRHVEAFHARSVLEAAGQDTFVHFDSNVAVEGSEIAESALLTASEIDHLIQMLNDLVDRTGGHNNSHSSFG